MLNKKEEIWSNMKIQTKYTLFIKWYYIFLSVFAEQFQCGSSNNNLELEIFL